MLVQNVSYMVQNTEYTNTVQQKLLQKYAVYYGTIQYNIYSHSTEHRILKYSTTNSILMQFSTVQYSAILYWQSTEQNIII